jgi:4-amino-4-deoxy-L-arabinose transferase-like glycosyltransferase
MTSKSTPQQEQQGQQAPKEGSLLQRYATSLPATPEDMTGAGNHHKQPPRSFLSGQGPGRDGVPNTTPVVGQVSVLPNQPPASMGPPQGNLNGGSHPSGSNQGQPGATQMPALAQPNNPGPLGPQVPQRGVDPALALMQQMPQPPSTQAPQPLPNPPGSFGSGLMKPQQGNAQQQPPPVQEREGKSVILYRSPNFFVRTTIKPSLQRPDPLRRPTGHMITMPRVMPGQKQYMAAKETRLMPSVVPINPLKAKRIPLPAWLEAMIIVLGLLITLGAHAFNMFNFPRYDLDEGTYMENAWAILHGMLSPYAYGYGHPPLAWIQIAAWVQLVGGFFSFGDAVNTGRVLMLFYALGSALLVYLIVRRLGSSRTAGLLAMMLFALSPLAIIYQRQVLLDNVGTFWFLLSLYLMVVGESRLLFLVLSGLCMGVAILSKEIFVLFIPVMIYASWLHTTKFQRKFAMVAFTYAMMAFASTFVLMAVLKGELFPYGWFPWDTHPHLSLLDTYLQQVQRGNNQGSFSQQWQIWTHLDFPLMICSIVAVAFNLIMGWWNRKQLLLALMAISFWVLLIRGGVVFTFYIIPMIPLAAINAAFAVNTVLGWLGKLARFDLLRAGLLLCVAVAILPYDLIHAQVAFTQNPTLAQQEAITWVREHVPRNDFLVISDWMFVDLHQPGGLGVGNGATYPFANIYFNVATDPTVYEGLLGNNPDRIDYIVEDWTMQGDLLSNKTEFKIILEALSHAVPVATFISGDVADADQVTIYQVIHKFPPAVVMTPHGSQGTFVTSTGRFFWALEPARGVKWLHGRPPGPPLL